ncbi:MAG: hypothetical protein IJM32_09510 [Ruminococcus sp.]|nr:hypothetical protein [Ruminococcus sp.]
MKAAIITIAGVSGRFNEGVDEKDKRHKIIYYENDPKQTLLYHLLEKCAFADRIILVGGSRFDEVKNYCQTLEQTMREKITLAYNEHYADLASGYSLYVGLKTLFDSGEKPEQILFAEGDLDIDSESFAKVIASQKNVLTYSLEPIYANKAVVLYRDALGNYKYAFNSAHGLLSIDEPFSVILNSAQVWKFTDAQKLEKANRDFFENEKQGTNLCIIQRYIDSCKADDLELACLARWTNCNTRQDYKKILTYWESEQK